MAKLNDWIVANLNNPDFSSLDFMEVGGMNVDNTQLLDRDFYKNNKYIQELFTNNEGTFNENAFNLFYDLAASKFKEFQEGELLDNFEYSLFDTRANADSKIRDPHFRFETVFNPDRRTIGVAGWNLTGERLWTPSELAQTLKIWDPTTESFLNETPNDSALSNGPIKYIKNLFSDPLVLATYDEDGEHYDPMSGQMVKHKKGQYKMNEEGTYYAEKLSGRSSIGKQVISALDLITVDGEGVNKYDFFDSDSLDKSATGTVIKNLAAVAPLLYSPIAGVYSGVLIARELTKSLPMLYGMASALFASDAEDSSTLNTLAAYALKFSGGVSEYGSLHTFSFENFGNLVGDVALQWGQQKTIAKAYNKLRGGSLKAFAKADADAKKLYQDELIKATQEAQQGIRLGKAIDLKRYFINSKSGDWRDTLAGLAAMQKFLPLAEKIAKRNARIGADLALAYMALVSNYDVYNDLIALGLTKREASIVATMSTAGMFSVDKFLNLGEVFFDDLDDLYLTAARRYLNDLVKEWGDTIEKGVKEGAIKLQELGIPKNIFQRVVRSGREVANKVVTEVQKARENLKYHTLSALGKAVGEGLEETSEEFVTDMSKQLYQWAGELGADTSKIDIGAWENMSDRYLMSFLGGSVGGGLFYTVDLLKMAIENKENPAAKQGERELIYLLRLKRKDEVLKLIDDMHNKGRLGSRKLSADHVYNEQNSERVFITADKDHISLNDFVYLMLVDLINQIDNIINNYGADLSDSDLFKLMVLGNDRLLRLQEPLDGVMFMTGYRLKYQLLVEDLVSVETEILAKKNEKTDSQERKEEKDKNELSETQTTSLSDLEERRDNILKLLEGFKDGSQSFYYTRMMLTMANPQIGLAFMFYTFDDWINRVKKRDPNTLSPAELSKYRDEYEIAKLKLELSLHERFDAYLDFEKKLIPVLSSIDDAKLTNLNKQIDDYKAVRKKIFEILQKGSVGWDTNLDGESPEEFENRNAPIEGETDELFQLRVNERKATIDKINLERFANLDFLKLSALSIIDYMESLPNGAIDPNTYRILKQVFITDRYYIWQEALKDSLMQDPTTPVEDFNELMLKEVQYYYKVLVEESEFNVLSHKKAIEEALRDFLLLGTALSTDSVNVDEVTRIINHLTADLALEPVFLREIDLSDDRLDPPSKEKIESWIATDLNNFRSDINKETNRLLDLISLYALLLLVLDDLKKLQDLLDFLISARLNQILNNIADPEIRAEIQSDIVNKLLLFIDKFNMNEVLKSEDESKLKVNISTLVSNLINSNPLSNKTEVEKHFNNEFLPKLEKFIIAKVNSHPFVALYSTAEKKLGDKNPILEIVSALADLFNVDKSTIELVISKIGTKLESSDLSNFILSKEELKSLQYISTIISLANSYIMSASSIPDWITPDGHNKFMNDFAKKVPDLKGYKELPELDGGLAAAYLKELTLYSDTIEHYNKIYTANKGNRDLMCINTRKAFEEARLKFYKDNITAFKKNPHLEVDLLDDRDLELPVGEIERRLAVNLFNYLKSKNKTLYEFLKESLLIELCIGKSFADLRKQTLTIVDPNYKYENLHLLDKLLFLITALTNNYLKFEDKAKLYISTEPEIIALATLNYLVRLGKGFLSTNGIIQDFLKYIQEKIDAPANLSECLMLIGGAGVGKSSVIARRIVEDVKEDELLLTAASSKKAIDLKNNIGKGKVIGSSTIPDPITKLMIDYVLDPSSVTEYTKMVKTLDNRLVNNLDYGTFRVKGRTLIDLGTIKVRKSANGVKVLVIDEASYIDAVTLQILNRWAKQNGVKIILCADTLLSGHKAGNIESNVVFCLFRLSPLTLSLRDANGYVMQNNLSLSNVVRLALDNYLLDFKKSLDKNKPLLKTINLDYYQSPTDLLGTLISKEVPLELIDILKTKSDIAFVGNSSSETLKLLTKAGVNISDSNIFENVRAIQGSEFDYVICDLDWKNKTDSSIREGYDEVEFLQELYTVNSRARNGIVLIDNGLLDIIESNNLGNLEITFPSIQDSADKFKLLEMQRYANMDFDPSIDRHDLSDLETKVPEKEKEEEKEKEKKEEKRDEEKPKEEDKGSEETGSEEAEKKEDTEGGDEEENNEGEDSEKNDDEEETVTLEGDTIESDTEKEEPLIHNTDMSSFVSRGYFMPILGSAFRREIVDKDTTKNVYLGSEDGVLRDCDIVIKNRSELTKGEALTNSQMQTITASFLKFVRTILRPDINDKKIDISQWQGPNGENLLEDYYIDLNHLQHVLLGEVKGEGIYIVYNEEDQNDAFIGFTSARHLKDTYRYVLRFKNSLDTVYEITLGFMGSPESWNKKVVKLDKEIKAIKKDGSVALSPEEIEVVNDLESEKAVTEQEIAKLVVFLKQIRDNRNKQVKVRLIRSFTTLREIGRRMRFGSLAVPIEGTNADGENPLYFREMGWLDDEGKYKYTSFSGSRGLYILGKSLEEDFGIKASNSGKVAVLISEFPYSPEEMLSAYRDSKARGDCKVRLVILSNAGISFSSLLRKNWSEVYKNKVNVTSEGLEFFTDLPISRDAFGYRLFGSLWNWRAYLNLFLTKVETFKNTVGAELLDRMLAVERAIFEAKSDNTADIKAKLTELKVTLSDSEIEEAKSKLGLLKEFNDLTLSSLHIFRLGHGHYLRKLNLTDALKAIYYNGLLKIPSGNPDVVGLFINEDLARQYLEYIDTIFKVFSNEEIGVDLNNLTILEGTKAPLTYGVSNEINPKTWNRVSTLSGLITSILASHTSLEIGDEEGNKEILNFSGLGERLSIGKFAISILKILRKVNVYWYDKATASNPDEVKSPKYILFKKDDKTKIKLDISPIVNLNPRFVDEREPNEFRNALMDLFDYMIHGTTLDVSRVNPSKIGTPSDFRITDAWGKKGIFCDPDRGPSANAIKSTTGENLMFDAAIHPYLVTTDTTSSLALDLEVIPEVDEEEPSESEGNEEREERADGADEGGEAREDDGGSKENTATRNGDQITVQYEGKKVILDENNSLRIALDTENETSYYVVAGFDTPIFLIEDANGFKLGTESELKDILKLNLEEVDSLYNGNAFGRIMPKSREYKPTVCTIANVPLWTIDNVESDLVSVFPTSQLSNCVIIKDNKVNDVVVPKDDSIVTNSFDFVKAYITDEDFRNFIYNYVNADSDSTATEAVNVYSAQSGIDAAKLTDFAEYITNLSASSDELTELYDELQSLFDECLT